jgi:uncharacterized membrane protein YqhA
MRSLETFFGRVLWNSRYLALIAVVASLIGAIVMFVVSGVDAIGIIGAGFRYATSDPNIVALGLYELFIGKIAQAEDSELAERLLLVRSLDDLKGRLSSVIFLILIVRYFEYALEATIDTSLDLLYLAVGIALVALGLFLTKKKNGSSKSEGV